LGFFEIFVEIALGSNVGVVLVVAVVVVLVLEPLDVLEPLEVLVDVDAVVVGDFFEAPFAEPLVFVVAPVALAPPLAPDAPWVVWPPPFGALAPAFDGLVGALPAPRPCAAAVVPRATTATAVTAKSENLRMVVESLRGVIQSKNNAAPDGYAMCAQSRN
jgi:hypothetical protein